MGGIVQAQNIESQGIPMLQEWNYGHLPKLKFNLSAIPNVRVACRRRYIFAYTSIQNQRIKWAVYRLKMEY